MDTKKYFINPIKNHYFSFGGRATRTQYWMFELNWIVFYIVLTIIEVLLNMGMVLTGLFTLATIIPALGFELRRFRDAGFSPWWVLLYIIPILGWIAVIIMHCQKSKN